jgi:hypothetical protein
MINLLPASTNLRIGLGCFSDQGFVPSCLWNGPDATRLALRLAFDTPHSGSGGSHSLLQLLLAVGSLRIRKKANEHVWMLGNASKTS